MTEHHSESTQTQHGSERHSLRGRKILITGASGSIGAAIGKRLANEGATLALHYYNNVAPVQQLLTEIEPQQAFKVQGALNNYAEAKRVFSEAKALLGGVDVLINSIGLSRDNSLFMLSEEDAAVVIQGNLAPIIYLSEFMCDQAHTIAAGRIINITSITGLVGQPMRALYGAAKGAVIAYTKCIARDIAERGWTANCIAPQVVQGGLAEHMKAKKKSLLTDLTPIRRDCTPEDLTALAMFLASQQSGFITGTVLNVTGGLITW